jgi:hypothetical protein
MAHLMRSFGFSLVFQNASSYTSHRYKQVFVGPIGCEQLRYADFICL